MFLSGTPINGCNNQVDDFIGNGHDISLVLEHYKNFQLGIRQEERFLRMRKRDRDMAESIEKSEHNWGG